MKRVMPVIQSRAGGVPARWRWTLAAAVSAAIAWLSLADPALFKPLPRTVPFSDKLGHLVAYGVYAAVLTWALSARRLVSGTLSLFVVAYCVAYGALMEVLQGALRAGLRSFSVLDMAANLLGAGVFTALFTGLQLRARRTRRACPA